MSTKEKLLYINKQIEEEIDDDDKYETIRTEEDYYIPFSKIPSNSEIIKSSLLYMKKKYSKNFPEKLVKDKLEKLSSKEIRTIFSANVLDTLEFKKYEDRLLVDVRSYGIKNGTEKFLKKRSDKLDKKQFGSVVEHKEDKQRKFELEKLFSDEIKQIVGKQDKVDGKRNKAQGDLKDISSKAKGIQTPQSLSSKIESEVSLPVARRKELREMVKKNGFRLNQLTKRAQMLVRISKGEK